MGVLLILVFSCFVFRGLGFIGVAVFESWRACARDALSLMLVFTGISHFTFMKSALFSRSDLEPKMRGI
jgi:hypothetical protein